MGKDTATVAESLRQHGWNTAWFGKTTMFQTGRAVRPDRLTYGQQVWDLIISTAL